MFLPLVWVADLVGLRTLDAPRAARGRRRGAAHDRGLHVRAPRHDARANALLAAGLVTTSGSVLWVTGPVNADGPSLALSVLAVAFALRYRDDPRLRTAVWVGLAAGGAVSIKALSVPARGDRRPDRAAVAPAAPAGRARRRGGGGDRAGACTWWRRCRSASPTCGTSRTRTTRTPAARTRHWGAVRKILDTLWDRDCSSLVALALAAIAFVVRFVGAGARAGRRPATGR